MYSKWYLLVNACNYKGKNLLDPRIGKYILQKLID